MKNIRCFNLFSRPYSTVPQQALVARFQKHGPPSAVLKLQKESVPGVPSNGVIVKMLYAPINPSDINIISGTYPISPSLPGIPGSEGVGKVVAVGTDSKKVKIGDLVLPGNNLFGTWRNFASCQETDVIVLPPSASSPRVKPEYLSVISINPATAVRLLNDFASLKQGDVIIQNGANSMVGLSVVQLAAARGIKTINIIRRKSNYSQNVELIKQHGGSIVCADDYIRTAEFRNLIKDLPKPKLALNCIGGPTTTEMARLLQPGSTLVTYGGMSNRPVTIPTSSFIFNDITCKGFWLTQWYQENGTEKKLQLLTEIIGYIEKNQLKLWLEKHPFEQLDQALARALDNQAKDRKVILDFETKK